jgi:chromosomal replication initiation ATPase DnaA
VRKSNKRRGPVRIAFGLTLMNRAVDMTAAATGVPAKDLRGSSRHREIAWARFACMAALRERGKSFPQIALFFGFDHTSVIHGVRRAAELESQCPDFKHVMQQLRREFVSQ